MTRMHLWRFNLHKTNAANEELVSVSVADAKSKKGRRYTNCYLHSNSLSNKMDNSLLAVRDINHKYIVVERRYSLDIQQYISDRLDSQISWYSKKSQHAKKMYRTFQVADIIIAASIPLLSAYTIENATIAIIVGILGAIITITEAVSKLYRWHEEWIEYRFTCEALKRHKILYLTNSDPYDNTQEINGKLLVSNVEAIISSENKQWKVNSFETPEKKASN